MKRKKQIESLGRIAISLSTLVEIPLIILLLSMFTGIGEHSQYGYSMYTVMLIFLGAIPLLLGIIFGIVTYVKYLKNRHKLPISVKETALLALFLPIISTILMFLAIILDTFVF